MDWRGRTGRAVANGDWPLRLTRARSLTPQPVLDVLLPVPSADPRANWRTVNILVLVPFIGLALHLIDPPAWLQVLGIAAMLTLVAVGSSRLLRTTDESISSPTSAQPNEPA